MCGIAGVIMANETPEQTQLEKSALLLGHRGPNACGAHIHERVGLVHTRLSIIDIDGGDQPILDPQARYALVANGEIYNHVELRQALISDGCRFRSRSDSEVALHLYERYGVHGFQLLNGMFAFALYDIRQKTLLLVRDRFGIKPLYYARLMDRIIFASELKALLPLMPRTPDISPVSLIRFLETGFNSAEETIFQGVERVPPGSILRIKPQLQVDTVDYWTPLGLTTEHMQLDEAVTEFDHLFDRVLNEHMRSDVPYGLFLSGGIDSGALLARLSQGGEKPIRTFSVGFNGVNTKDELNEARAMANTFHSDHTELQYDLSQIFSALPMAAWAADDLFYDAACLPTALMARRAAGELKVVFTGEGGDEVFAGYGRYRRNGLQRLLTSIGRGYRNSSRWPFVLSHRAYGESLKSKRSERDRPVQSFWMAPPQRWSYLQRAQYTDIRTELADGLLVKVDRMLMASGLEGRVPYLDHRIVEFGLSLPDSLKIRGRVGKLMLRHWASRYLPKQQVLRRKRGFSVPLGNYMRGDLLVQIGGLLKRNPIIQEWFHPGAVPLLISRQQAKGDVTAHIVKMIQLALWYRFFLQGAPLSQPGVEEDPRDYI
jgi:asparagine synthase (glutamine-hydrolysing)